MTAPTAANDKGLPESTDPTVPGRTPEASETEGVRRCQGLTDGRACEAPSDFVSATSRYCWSHDPSRESERLQASRLGGMQTARRFKRQRLEEGELGALNSPADAARWCEIVARAVATGRLSSSQAQSITRAVSEWTRARDLHVRETRLGALERKIAAMSGNGAT